MSSKSAEPADIAAVEDPYLTWARGAGHRYLARRDAFDPASGSILIAGEIRSGSTLAQAQAAVTDAGGVLAVRPAHAKRGAFSGELARPTETVCGALLRHAAFVLAEPGMSPACAAPRQAPAAAPAVARKPKKCPQSVVVGVIDGLCGFANERFDAGSSSALDYFWDQGADPGADGRWTRPSEFGYGRQLGPAQLNQMVKDVRAAGGSRVQRAAAERALYGALGHGMPADADWSHGTHVLDTVVSDFADGGAGAPPVSRPGLVYVQLPEVALRDTSGRWCAAYVLDAIAYVLSHAKRDAQVVINLSLGAFAGPHDGSSPLERAIDAIVAGHPDDRLTVVVAAGNAQKVFDDGTGEPRVCHARFTLEAAGGPQLAASRRSRVLVWDIDVPDATESFMELWVPELAQGACAVDVTLQHQTLAGFGTGVVGPGEVGAIPSGKEAMAMVVNATGPGRVPNGDGGMVLIALGHTRDDGGPAAPAGRWTVKVTNRCDRPITVDAWIERRDMPGELAGFRPQYGFADEPVSGATAGAFGTLANGRRTVVVGALDQEQDRQTSQYRYRISEYSASGVQSSPGDCNPRAAFRRQPDVYGVGKRNAGGYLSGSAKELAGTSVAAAQVSAAIACVLAQRASGSARAAGNILDDLQVFARKRQAGPVQAPGGSAGSRASGLGDLLILPPRTEQADGADSASTGAPPQGPGPAARVPMSLKAAGRINGLAVPPPIRTRAGARPRKAGPLMPPGDEAAGGAHPLN